MLQEINPEVHRTIRDGNSPYNRYWDERSTFVLPISQYPFYLQRIASGRFKKIEEELKMTIPPGFRVCHMAVMIALAGSEVLSVFLQPEHQVNFPDLPPEKVIILTDSAYERENNAYGMAVNFTVTATVESGRQFFEGSIILPDYTREHRMPLDLLYVGIPTVQVLNAERQLYVPPERSISELDFITFNKGLGYTRLYSLFIQSIRDIGTRYVYRFK